MTDCAVVRYFRNFTESTDFTDYINFTACAYFTDMKDFNLTLFTSVWLHLAQYGHSLLPIFANLSGATELGDILIYISGWTLSKRQFPPGCNNFCLWSFICSCFCKIIFYIFCMFLYVLQLFSMLKYLPPSRVPTYIVLNVLLLVIPSPSSQMCRASCTHFTDFTGCVN